MKTIYMDHNASTPLLAEVIEAMKPFLEGQTGNPSSTHVWGLHCKAAVEKARREVASMLGCHFSELIFTSGGTESNNWVLQSLARKHPGSHMITTSIEHPAILKVCDWLETQGVQITRLAVNALGQVAVADVERAIRPETRLITVMLANNEVGSLQPLAAISQIAKERGILLHSDAAQAVGKTPVSVRELGVDFLSLAGHKFNAPKGVGALYIREGVDLPPLLFGAGHERGLRPGTENVLELVGLGCAARVFQEQCEQRLALYQSLRDHFCNSLKAQIPSIRINAESADRLPNTASITFQNVLVDDLFHACKEVAASAGAACHADHQEPSHVLAAMGFDEKEAASTARFSVGHGSCLEDVNDAVSALVKAYNSLT
jgi:cysteine desulfurase